MISEHQFASSYTSVWQAIAPLGDGYWHVENRLTKRMAPPMSARAPTSQRAAINETAFRAFCKLQPAARVVDRKTILNAVDDSVEEALLYVMRFTRAAMEVQAKFDDDCRREAGNLVLRLLHYFPGVPVNDLRPQFPGCGMLSSCEGDIVLADCLYEIKAGDRAFRITDLRQLLVYAALAYSNRALNFSKIGLFNPRTGLFWIRSIDQVCISISGSMANDMLPALVDQFSMASVSR